MRFLTVFAMTFLLSSVLTLPAFAAAENGPAEIMLESTLDRGKKARPAFFPHGTHQARLECAHCHHGQDADGKLVAFTAGQAIASCETCHNSANTNMKKDLNTFQKAGHALCRDCHRTIDAKLAKCSVCHHK